MSQLTPAAAVAIYEAYLGLLETLKYFMFFISHYQMKETIVQDLGI